jgi:hypothetical protein
LLLLLLLLQNPLKVSAFPPLLPTFIFTATPVVAPFFAVVVSVPRTSSCHEHGKQWQTENGTRKYRRAEGFPYSRRHRRVLLNVVTKDTMMAATVGSAPAYATRAVAARGSKLD